MYFTLTILLTAFLMEAIGSYISIVGLSSIFAGDPVILTMALILDIAKITSVSFLYQYWNDIAKTMRIYMTTAVVILMLITSAGAFGYLSGAFQKAIQPNLEVSLRVESFQREEVALLSEKKELSSEQSKMNQQLAQLPPDYVSGRQRLLKSFKPEQDRIRSRLDIVNKRTDELRTLRLKTESENIEKDAHTGPITYIAKAFDVSTEEASKWIILTIIFVFDPLAIMLLLAANFLIKRRDFLKIVNAGPVAIVEPIVIKPEPIVIKPVVVQPNKKQRVKTPKVFTPPVQVSPVQVVLVSDIQVESPVLSLEPEIINEIKPIDVEPAVPQQTEAAEFIDAPPLESPESQLASLQVNYPQALFRDGVKTTLIRRRYYSGL